MTAGEIPFDHRRGRRPDTAASKAALAVEPGESVHLIAFVWVNVWRSVRVGERSTMNCFGEEAIMDRRAVTEAVQEQVLKEVLA